jgi:glycine dehydrogenase subunit 1
MSKYIPHTKEETTKMLESLGLTSLDDLFLHIDKSSLVKETLTNTPLKEFELSRLIEDKFKNHKNLNVFRGAGAYEHFIPKIVDEITSKSEFYTAYTPYQSEVSQGTLSYIFEFQSLLTRLTGLDYCNASMYDADTALAESIIMVSSGKHKVYVLDTLDKTTIETIKTYTFFRNIEVVIIDINSFFEIKEFDSETFGLVVSVPNFYGYIEDIDRLSQITTSNNINLIMLVDPITLGVLKTPKEYNASCCVLNLQTLGIPLSFGGPYNSAILTTPKFLRKLPGRIVGLTTDSNNNVCYTLTLTAREQHIRRQNATSNICSNQSLMCLRNVVYLSYMGNNLSNIDYKMIENSHLLYDLLMKTNLFVDEFKNNNFIKEFTLKPLFDSTKLDDYLVKKGYLGPLFYNGSLIFCATETKTKQDIINFVKEITNYAL